MGLPDRPSKHEAFLALLREGWTSLHLDARREGVIVPDHLKGEGHLVLQYGNDLPIPIPDLQVDEEGVTATLSFARSPHQTVVPWDAVYVVASSDGRGVLYHEDIPTDVSVVAGRGQGEPGGQEHGSTDAAQGGVLVDAGIPSVTVNPSTVNVPRPTPPRALRAVPLSGSLEDHALEVVAQRVETIPARRRKRPQLRLVK
jgi:stringent starvation protein B